MKKSVQYEKQDDGIPLLAFEHIIEANNDEVYFAFTYPYTYEMVQDDLKVIDEISKNVNMSIAESIYCTRELVINSIDGLRVDLITITSVSGVSANLDRECTFPGLFPSITDKTEIADETEKLNLTDRSDDVEKSDDSENTEIMKIVSSTRPYIFPDKEIVFISARVHPGEVTSYLIFLFNICS